MRQYLSILAVALLFSACTGGLGAPGQGGGGTQFPALKLEVADITPQAGDGPLSNPALYQSRTVCRY